MADKRSEATGGHRRSDDGRGLDKPPAVGDTDSGPDCTRQGDKAVDLLKDNAGEQDAQAGGDSSTGAPYM